ncbi:MAG: 16S rRNA (adenine(1518)-N(6)/adenine(1519)-N(6))-dimethyltransferase RsmA [Chitinophagaceae bacterium]|nr:16S rRNA (adenine(1518)-N(6)/adenine(1519)-N(6))-dimethyltransferase RsmA [Chitinophagaceae bacterium]
MLSLKKSLGQHLLTDENISRKIIQALRAIPVQRLLEIGPGGGALTKYFTEDNLINFFAVEIDKEKVDFLLRTYPSLKGKILHQDVLTMEIPFDQPFAVLGNFPYNISSQILFKMLEWKHQITHVVGMFQKEVARRITSPPGGKFYGITSVLIQTFFKAEYLFDVSETCFTPPPKVKSGVIRLTPADGIPPMRSENDLFHLVKTAFQQRRKMLRNAVKELFEPDILQQEIFQQRAEQLVPEQFAELTFFMK